MRGVMTLRVNTAAGVYDTTWQHGRGGLRRLRGDTAANLFRRSAATFCRIVFYDLAAARRYTLGGRVDT